MTPKYHGTFAPGMSLCLELKNTHGVVWCGVAKVLLLKVKSRDVSPQVQVNARDVCVVRAMCASVFRGGEEEKGDLEARHQANVVSTGAAARLPPSPLAGASLTLAKPTP